MMSSRPRNKRWIAIVLCASISVDAGAAMSQLPLTWSTSSVAPNLMFTLDNSTSMELECVPDGLCVKGSTRVQAMPWYNGVYRSSAVVATYNSYSLYARQMRSPDTNPAYYNPRVRYRPWLKSNGSRYAEYPAHAAPDDPNRPTENLANLVALQTLGNVWATELVDGFTRSSQPITNETFWPAQYFQLTPGRTGSSMSDFTQVIIAQNKSFPKPPGRTDCAGTACTYEEEAQNFSNWYTYARNRIKVAIGGTSEAFAAVPSTFRVGYGTINNPSTNVDGIPTTTIAMGVRPFSASHRDTFYDLLQKKVTLASGTPLRRAMDDVGQYFSRTDDRSPWSSNPEGGSGGAGSNPLSCRRSFHVLMTDGIWNDEGGKPSSVTDADVDSVAGPEIVHADEKTKYRYTPTAPYAAAGDPSLADVALYYWSRDLQKDLPNDVPGTDRDPAFWQHLVNYTIGLGITGQLRNPEDLPALIAGKSWGTPKSGSIDNVDDLWHAAINSRGKSANARSSQEYANTLRSMVEDIVARSSTEAGVAVSGRSYSPTTVKYIPGYKSGAWTGEVEARNLSNGSTAWYASEKLPAPSSRSIYTLGPDSSGIPFTTGALTSSVQSQLGVSLPGGLVEYLRGDRTKESAGVFRQRASVLGDIVNSAPVLVKDLVDSQYDFLPASTAGRSSYLSYLSSKKYRSAQLFVGANDGMLHAFNAGTGVESFAYVPRTVLPSLSALADPNYEHRYFVDGPVAEFDIYDKDDGKWRNLVVGTGGAGAKNMFAINVPVPTMPASGDPVALSAQASAPGKDDILWEINSDHADYKELGHVLQPPESGITQDGTWVMVFGNGYDSVSKRAQLYVINARTGARIAVLDTGWGHEGWPNGLGGVKLVRDSNKRIMYAYAGDLYGSMWKFDLSSTTTSNWNIAFGKTPLFWGINSAGQNEPFTATPAVMPHPLGGFMVLAGTGKLFESPDAFSTMEQTLYGVWDRVPLGGDTSQDKDNVGYSWNPTLHNASLVTQTITGLKINDRVGDYFALSNNSVDYGSGSTGGKRGWKIRMSIKPGQRLIYAPQIASGRVIFDTMAPGGNGSSCESAGPQGYTFVIDPFSGAPSQEGPTFDTNDDGQFTAADNVSAAITHSSSIGQRQIVRIHGTTQVRLEGAVAPGSTSNSSKKVNLGGTPAKRQWRQIAAPPSY